MYSSYMTLRVDQNFPKFSSIYNQSKVNMREYEPEKIFKILYCKIQIEIYVRNNYRERVKKRNDITANLRRIKEKIQIGELI